MEKTISYSQFQSVKAVAKAIDPIMRKFKPIDEKIKALEEDRKFYQTQIDALEQGIVQILGFHVSDLVKKVVEVTGTTADGKPIKSTKYVPTENVAYDEAKKQYIVTVGEPETIEVPAPSESVFGNDFDADKEKIQQKAQNEINPISNDTLFE
jgi:predicted transcriptional regulator